MIRSTQTGLGWLAWLSVVSVAATAAAQDPTKVGPGIYKTVLENEHVRVCEVTFKPGARIAAHSHPDHLVYVVTNGALKLNQQNSEPKYLAAPPGTAVWIPAETHAAENVGDTEVRLVVFELKNPAQPGAPSTGAPPDKDIVKLAPECAKVLLENDRVRIHETRLKPGQKEPMHAHPAHVVYALTDAAGRFTSSDGTTTEKSFRAGQAVWSAALTHSVENIGTDEVLVLVVELKEPLPPANLPGAAPAEQP